MKRAKPFPQKHLHAVRHHLPLIVGCKASGNIKSSRHDRCRTFTRDYITACACVQPQCGFAARDFLGGPGRPAGSAPFQSKQLCEFCNTQADPGKMTDSTDNGNVKTKTKQKKLNQPLLSMIKDKLIRPTKFNDFTAKTHLSPHSSTEQHKNLSLSAPPPTGTTSVTAR